MSEMVLNIISGIAYLILAPVIGGLLAGLDRKISARMQRRVGPPVLQPFYDFFKLWDKQPIAVNEAQRFYVFGFLLFVIISGLFFPVLLYPRGYPAGCVHPDDGQRMFHRGCVFFEFSLQPGRGGKGTGSDDGV